MKSFLFCLVILHISILPIQIYSAQTLNPGLSVEKIVGSDLNEQLLKAVKMGNIKGFKKLLKNECIDINYQDEQGYTALMYASSMPQRSKFVKILLQNRAQADIQRINVSDSSFGGQTALMLAAIAGYIDIVKMLIDAGADLNLQNKNGRTALLSAALKGNTNIVRLLIERGARFDIQDECGFTPLMHAIQNGRADVIRLLLIMGAGLAVRNEQDIEKIAHDYARSNLQMLQVIREGLTAREEFLRYKHNFKSNITSTDYLSGIRDISDIIGEYAVTPFEENITGEESSHMQQ